MTNFKKYDSIENHYRSNFISKIYEMFGDDFLCEVTEKIHGANFSMYIDLQKNTVRYAKRTCLIASDDNFYNFKKIFGDSQEKFEAQLINDLKEQFKHCQIVQICGELHGGDGKTVKKIQSGIWYSNEIRFMVFDVLVDGKLLPPSLIYNLSDSLYIAPSFGIMPFKDALEFDVEGIISEAADETREGNFIEGVVIKPLNPLFFGNGERVIVKKISSKFREVVKKANKNKELSKEELNLWKSARESVEPYCTKLRLDKLYGNYGDDLAIGETLSLYCVDVLNDMQKDEVVWEWEDKKKVSYLKKSIPEFVKPWIFGAK